jgi:hypothetical protein
MDTTTSHRSQSDRDLWLHGDVILFVALLSSALALGGALAHVLELPNKIPSRDEYFTVQAIYRGWWQLAYLIAIQFVAILAVIVVSRREPMVFIPALVAAVSLVGAQAVFWAYTYPTNVATINWTSIPENWETLRRQWEFSHAAGAALQALAMSALIVAALARGRSARRVGRSPRA